MINKVVDFFYNVQDVYFTWTNREAQKPFYRLKWYQDQRKFRDMCKLCRIKNDVTLSSSSCTNRSVNLLRRKRRHSAFIQYYANKSLNHYGLLHICVFYIRLRN